MKRLAVFLVLLISATSFSQENKTFSLQMLYEAFEMNHPISKINPALDSVTALQISNIRTTYLPKMDFNATATWQSDVIEFNINLPIPGIVFPSPDPDQYKLTLDVTQVIWDGGATKVRKEIAQSQLNADKSSIVNELYSFRDKINDAFFSVILLNVGLDQLKLMHEELNARLETLKSGVREGVVLPSAGLSLEAEILRLEQKMIEIPARKASLFKVIESLTGLTISPSDSLVLPNIKVENENTILRPELSAFESQKSLFDSRAKLTSAKRMPVVSGFVTAGYGKPGLNMLSADWDNYIVAGARLSWNIWDWNQAKREREQLKIQSSVIDFRRKAFSEAVNSQISSSLSEIETLNQQIEKDEKIVSLLDEVKAKSASQMANGTKSSSEFLSDFNAAARAKLDMEQRKIMLEKEKTKLNYLIGK